MRAPHICSRQKKKESDCRMILQLGRERKRQKLVPATATPHPTACAARPTVPFFSTSWPNNQQCTLLVFDTKSDLRWWNSIASEMDEKSIIVPKKMRIAELWELKTYHQGTLRKLSSQGLLRRHNANKHKNPKIAALTLSPIFLLTNYLKGGTHPRGG
jgi:hypothetical protein